MPAEHYFTIHPNAVYTDGEIRLALSLTSATLARARRERKLRFTRQGRQFLYRGQWLLDWLESEAARPAALGGVAAQ